MQKGFMATSRSWVDGNKGAVQGWKGPGLRAGGFLRLCLMQKACGAAREPFLRRVLSCFIFSSRSFRLS